MPSQVDKDNAKKGIKARNEAVTELIKRHLEEFNELHARNRVAAGLPIRPQGPTRQELEDRIRREEEKLAKWREQLRQVND